MEPFLALTRTFARSFSAFVEWIAHSLLCIGVYACIQGMRWSIQKLTLDGHDPSFFGYVKIDWIFDGADLMLLLAFAYFGVMAAVRAYRGSE